MINPVQRNVPRHNDGDISNTLSDSMTRRNTLNDLEKRKALQIFICRAFESGVGNGTRTHDNRNHNPGLYQLSYSHHLVSRSVLLSRDLNFT